MARRSGPRKSTVDKGLDFLTALVAEQQKKNKVEEVISKDDLIEYTRNAPVHQKDINMLQAEGVLLHLHTSSKVFITKTCKRDACQSIFSTMYKSVAYCSEVCRAKELREKFGIEYDPKTDHYANLGNERPLVVTAEAHQVLVNFALRILANQNVVLESLGQEALEIPQEYLEVQSQYNAENPASSSNGSSHQSTDAPQTNPVVLPALSDFPLLPPLGGPAPS